MNPKLLLLGKDQDKLEDLAIKLQTFTINIITEVDEKKISELLSYDSVNIIVLDTSLSEQERAKHKDDILSLNQTIPYHLISNNKDTAFKDLTSFLKTSLRAINQQSSVEKYTSIQQPQTKLFQRINKTMICQ